MPMQTDIEMQPSANSRESGCLERHLLDSVPELAFLLDDQLTCLHINPPCAAYLGLSSDDAAGQTLEQLAQDGLQAKLLLKAASSALLTGKRQQTQCSLSGATDSEAFEALAFPSSSPGGVVVLLRPTERESSAPVCSSEALASSVVAVLQCSPEGHVTCANDAAHSLLGHDFEATPMNWIDLVAPHHAEIAASCALQLKEQQRFGSTELDMVAKSGRLVPFICSASTTEDGGSTTLLLVDISERKYAEQSQAFIAEAGRVLASSLDFGRTLDQVARLSVPSYADWCFVDIVEDENSVNRLVVAHSDPAHVEIAQTLRRSYPFRAASVNEVETRVEVDVEDLHVEHHAITHPHLGLLVGLGIKSYMVVPMVARQRVVGFLTFISCKWNYDGKNLSCAEELARRAALCIDNARLYGEAQAATRIREEFLSTASHELKTPLTSLKLQVQSLRRMRERPEALDDEKLVRRLDAIGRQVDRQVKLVDILLDISRIGADRLALEPEDFDLSELLREIVARFDHEVADPAARPVLSCPEGIQVHLDRVRVDQVVTNFVSNAIKYGCGRPVEVTLRDVGQELEIIVEDHGIGISSQDQLRIFDRFERAVSGRNFSGFGLGLWITNQITQAMGGSIGVKSEVNLGSKFTVRLPRGTH